MTYEERGKQMGDHFTNLRTPPPPILHEVLKGRLASILWILSEFNTQIAELRARHEDIHAPAGPHPFVEAVAKHKEENSAEDSAGGSFVDDIFDAMEKRMSGGYPGAVAPTLRESCEAMREVIRACGYDFDLLLDEAGASDDAHRGDAKVQAEPVTIAQLLEDLSRLEKERDLLREEVSRVKGAHSDIAEMYRNATLDVDRLNERTVVLEKERDEVCELWNAETERLQDEVGELKLAIGDAARQLHDAHAEIDLLRPKAKQAEAPEALLILKDIHQSLCVRHTGNFALQLNDHFHERIRSAIQDFDETKATGMDARDRKIAEMESAEEKLKQERDDARTQRANVEEQVLALSEEGRRVRKAAQEMTVQLNGDLEDVRANYLAMSKQSDRYRMQAYRANERLEAAGLDPEPEDDGPVIVISSPRPEATPASESDRMLDKLAKAGIIAPLDPPSKTLSAPGAAVPESSDAEPRAPRPGWMRQCPKTRTWYWETKDEARLAFVDSLDDGIAPWREWPDKRVAREGYEVQDPATGRWYPETECAEELSVLVNGWEHWESRPIETPDTETPEPSEDGSVLESLDFELDLMVDLKRACALTAQTTDWEDVTRANVILVKAFRRVEMRAADVQSVGLSALRVAFWERFRGATAPKPVEPNPDPEPF